MDDDTVTGVLRLSLDTYLRAGDSARDVLARAVSLPTTHVDIGRGPVATSTGSINDDDVVTRTFNGT